MALLGSSVDPRLFVQDYSGFTRAADIQAQSMANLGSQIAGGIERYGEQKQERKKLDAGIKATVTGIESAIKMGKSLGIDVESSLTPYLDKINDPNVSPVEAAAYAKEASNTISNALGFGMKANEMGIDKARYEAGVAARIAELQAEANKPGPITDVNVPGGTVQMRTNPRTGVLEPLQVAKQTPAAGITSALGDATPMDIPTTEGIIIPANEGVTSPDGTTVSYLGRQYTVDTGVLPARTPNEQAASVDAGLSAIPTKGPVGFKPAKTDEQKGEVVTQEEANRRTASGLSVTATPVGQGMVRITSQTGSPKPSPVIESPESKLQTQRLLKLDESLGSLREVGTTASLDIQPLKEIINLLDTNVKTGFGRETLMQARKILGQDVSNEEQFQAMVGAEAMKNIALTKGAISDREMDYFKTVLSPNMGKTTEGNKKIIEFRIKYANRANKIAKTVSNLQKNKKDPYEIQEAVDEIISSESLLDNRGTEKSEVNQAAEDATFLGGY